MRKDKSTSHLVPNTVGSDEVAWHGKAIHWTWSDEIIKDPNRDACLTANGERYSPSQFNAFVLGKMLDTGEAHQRSVEQAVVAVLVYCGDAQGHATKDVGNDPPIWWFVASSTKRQFLHSLPTRRTQTLAIRR